MLKRLIFAVIACVLFLLLAELSARQFEQSVSEQADQHAIPSGWQERFFADVFDWHEPDPELLWRLKPNLSNRYIRTNSNHTVGPEIINPKPPSSFRILLLGDSSPLGLGLNSYDQSFGFLLRRLVQGSFGSDRRVELVNAAVAGYSSEQLRRYFQMHGEQLEPDLVVLYCGNNDASISGYYTDRELLEAQRLKWLREQLASFALFRMVRAAVGPSRQATLSDGRRFMVRVPPLRFGENLEEIAVLCHRLSCRLIVVKPPVPLMWPAGLQFKWFGGMKSSDGQLVIPGALAAILNRPIRYCLDRDQMPARYGNPDKITRRVYASAYLDTLAPDCAFDYYRDELDDDPNSPILLNNLGVAYWELDEHDIADRHLRAARKCFVQQSATKTSVVSEALGSVFLFNIGINLLSGAHGTDGVSSPDTILASTYLDSALQADYLSLRVKRTYLNEIDRLGEQDGDVAVIDLSIVFAKNGGESLFIDHCHPTSAGHVLIAQEIHKAITPDHMLFDTP